MEDLRKQQPNILQRPPVVTILGHVDHGKTTLLDTIRKTNVALREHGGITQHIGAYQIELSPKQKADKKKISSQKITFIDTPGHEAFSKMRSRGATVADIAILVVAANDGVMPQTIESISMIKEAKIPCIVALTKMDLPDIQEEKVKKQLTKQGLNLEEYGGNTPVIPVSAKTGKGVDKLLEMIAVVTELFGGKEEGTDKLKAVVIESTLSKNRGPVATVIIRNGQMIIGEELVCDTQEFKLRALITWLGENRPSASAGDPVEVLGWKEVPPVGSLLYKKSETELAKPVVKEIAVAPPLSLTEVLPAQLPNINQIKLILKSDTLGTLDAITESLKVNTDIVLLSKGVGVITESDIFLAKTTGALIVGFNIKPPDSIVKLAESEKVLIKTYHIIYELIDEITEVVEAIREGNLVNVLGEAKILALFPMKDQLIAGLKVISGRIARGDQVKVVRGEKELGRAKIKSLRHGKEDITKAEQGSEAGIILSQKIDLLTGDSIISIG